MKNADLWLIVPPAAGIGQRMNAECPPKQYLKINNRFILDITLSRLLDNAPPFKGCMVPLNPKDHWWPESESARDDRVQTCTGGGKERADSVLSALIALEGGQAADNDWVLVHDAARPVFILKICPV